METCKPFDIVVVPFPFTDRTTSKRRPALVLSSKAYQRDSGHVVLAMITTAARSSWPSDVALRQWRAAGLPRASKIRFKVFTLDLRLLLRSLGALSEQDSERVRAAARKVLSGFSGGA